jgi:hypothetical protein
MEVLVALPVIVVPFFFPVVTGLMAKTMGRKFWLWFWLGLLLPFVACVILLCLPVRQRAEGNEFTIQ